MLRSYKGLWFGSENVPKEMLLTGSKFHINTTSGSGVTLKEKTFAKEIFEDFIFAIYRDTGRVKTAQEYLREKGDVLLLSIFYKFS